MQGFNKYHPPDYDPAKHSSLNAYHGKHALGDRARKLDKGILIVRFELPYNIWCDHCNSHIGQGVRYNAEKSKVGNYYSTPIWNFRCKCHICQHWFEIRTDPANTRYVVHSGARQKHEEWDPAENGGIVLDQKTDTPPDAFHSLEKSVTQKTRALSAAAHLHALEEDRHSHWSDPYSASSLLRHNFRKAKKVRLESEGRAEGVRERYGLGERVGVQDLRTPAREEVREEEDRDNSTITPASPALQALSARLGLASALKADPFLPSRSSPSSSSSSSKAGGSSAERLKKARQLVGLVGAGGGGKRKRE
ncbi:CWC16 protein [Leucosporidium creatinivorum]|uniref:CWC16 protein n=1 Tax=Leucosporidium creatinivorum TaxID=106004 RepID=A0A1Y2FSW4_9BASI|nr:CWC16 protein [Leucosporidium creatinivorum]